MIATVGIAKAEKFITQNIQWTLDEIGYNFTIDCLKMTKPFEPPFKSKDIFIFLKKKGSHKATIAYLEYLCLVCCPSKKKLIEYAADFKRSLEEKTQYSETTIIQSK